MRDARGHLGGTFNAMHSRTTHWALVLGLGALGTGCSDVDEPEQAGADDGATTEGEDSSEDSMHDWPDEGPDDGPGDGPDGGDENARPNWHEDIAPLLAEHCSRCHDGEGIAFAMGDYAETRPWAEVMAIETASAQMPPWHAIEGEQCEPQHSFEGDPRLSDEQIQMFADWADAGTPLGDPDLAAPIDPPIAIDLADPTVTLPMQGSVTVQREGDKLDFFHCLSLDPGHTTDVFVDGLQFIPGNDRIAHHAIVYIDETGESASWPDGVLQECNGGTGVSSTTMIGGWVPGTEPTVTPDNVGIRLPVGARIIINVHYHADISGPQTDDTTALAMRWTSQAPRWVSEFRLIGTPGAGQSTSGDFIIPAGAVGHEESVEWTVPNDAPSVRVWAVANHMHKVGVDQKTDILRASESECLVQTPQWDFNWQRIYEIDLPIDQTPELRPGDKIRVRCTYDNVIDNPGVFEALAELGLDAPRDVVSGDGTLDEMCVAGLGLAVRL
ncbi:MAG: hypothetical protein JKY37_24210 [Nannocystaceae bacterium]|nr:hypothetical protein [Nannocystaceae bacterium]